MTHPGLLKLHRQAQEVTMEFRTLEVFYSVATLKSFARAADALYMTQPAVSQRIASLEAEVGGRLLERSVKGTSLTPKGEVLFMHADRLLRGRMEMMQAIADPHATSRLIRLGVAETIAQTWLPSFIGTVNTQYPSITFEIEVDVSTNLRTRLMRQEIDLAFLLGKVVEPGITSLDLCSYSLSFVASVALDLGKEPVSLKTLSQHPLICFPKTTIPYRKVLEMFQENSLKTPQIHCSSSVSTIIKMTLDNIGICVIAPILIMQELQEGRLRIVDTRVSLPKLDFTASFATAPGGKLISSLAQIAGKVAQQCA
ncbi:LysR family transcriptional regulator [Teichococcus oryzae]|uniref:LysR family transcriptional regulator n=1 Tax=Teichococcus oryzae TaxID=1608942 RepID=A0A5B2TC40_9PROT|nr:LysR family transcriptional regulator [Pseudoroseomonas oryzae]KAA2211653.1 LysR family transcriptional regulator [Pseudoroseomonas oryzae]